MAKELWDPFEEMKQFRKEMEEKFDNFWNKGKKAITGKELMIREPVVDIEDKKNVLEVTAELPGIDKKDVKINVEEDRVEINAKSTKEKEIKKKDFYKKERESGCFYRSLSLPAIVDPDKAKAKFTNGVMKLTLPKTKQLPKKRKTISLK